MSEMRNTPGVATLNSMSGGEHLARICYRASSAAICESYGHMDSSISTGETPKMLRQRRIKIDLSWDHSFRSDIELKGAKTKHGTISKLPAHLCIRPRLPAHDESVPVGYIEFCDDYDEYPANLTLNVYLPPEQFQSMIEMAQTGRLPDRLSALVREMKWGGLYQEWDLASSRSAPLVAFECEVPMAVDPSIEQEPLPWRRNRTAAYLPASKADLAEIAKAVEAAMAKWSSVPELLKWLLVVVVVIVGLLLLRTASR